MKTDLLQRLLQDRQEKRAVALITVIDSGDQSLVYETGFFGEVDDVSLLTVARNALRIDRSGLDNTDATPVFIQVFNPPLRLLIVGAVHITQFLVPMAQLCGYEVVIVDPRSAWSSAQRFQDVEIREQWPDEGLLALQPDRRSAIVTLTHDPKLDDSALQVALQTPAFYIGSLGSRRTHAARISRLQEAGIEPSQLDRIHAPVGLAINAKSPAEIALSIVAEITQALRTERAAADT